MCDVFTQNDAIRVLHGKTFLLIGDSILRNIYKDLIYLHERGQFLEPMHVKVSGERTFCGDKLMKGGRPNGETIRGRDYREERHFFDDNNDVEFFFYFNTRAYTEELEHWIRKFKDEEKYGCNGFYPDVILFNSCLWDTTRYGPDGPIVYAKNVKKLCKVLQEVLKDQNTQFIWMTMPPISTHVTGGLFVEQMQFLQNSNQINVVEANLTASNIVAQYGFDVLDMHYLMKNQAHRWANDGIHWNPDGTRFQANAILTHFCQSREIALPGRIKNNCMLEESKRIIENTKLDLEPEKRQDIKYPSSYEPKRRKSEDAEQPPRKKANDNRQFFNI